MIKSLNLIILGPIDMIFCCDDQGIKAFAKIKVLNFTFNTTKEKYLQQAEEDQVKYHGNLCSNWEIISKQEEFTSKYQDVFF
jgi:hypothetical protein